jgi:hypothetical protein
MRYIKDYDKKQAFNRIWFKQGNSPVRDRLKSKLEVRGLEPTEKNAFEYWMGYIRPQKDRRGNIIHANPKWSKYNEKKRNNNSRRVGRHNKKKRRRPQ